MMRIKKTMMAFAPIFMAAVILTGCGGSKKADVTVDVQKVADELNKTVTSEQLTSVTNDMIASNFAISKDDYTDGAAYMSSGATACEVAVIECKDADAAASVEKVFEQRKSDRTDLFASYNEGEASKLDSDVLETAGKYVAWCVTDDADAAKKVLDEYGFKK